MSGGVGPEDQIIELRREATKVRHAIETTDLSDEGNLSIFPKECCHHAIKLIAFHLTRLGWTDLQKVTGYRNVDPSRPHFWLLVGPVLIDITADQFAGEGQSPVIVTLDSPWHAGWKRAIEPLDRETVLEWPSMTDPGFSGYLKVLATLNKDDN